MADIVDLYGYKPRGRKPGTKIPTPRNPKLVLEVIRLRDEEGLSWREIGDLVDRSHQSPHLLYKRWKDRLS